MLRLISLASGPRLWVTLIVWTLMSGSLPAAVIGYWRFEDGGFLTDSGPNNLTLTNNGSVAQVTPLPGTGAGSDFPSVVPQTGQPNDGLASFAGTNSLSHADNALFAVQDFTIEAFFNKSSVATTPETIAGQFTDGGTNDRSWRLAASNGDLILGLSKNGESTGGNLVNLAGFAIDDNIDYYAAAAVDFGEFGGGSGDDVRVSFYLQDLTNGGSLQTNVVDSLNFGTLHNSTTLFTIGANTGNNVRRWTGPIDEVRWSNVALGQSELLIVPEPSSVALVLCGAVGVVLVRRRASIR